MQPLLDSFSALKEEFAGEPEVLGAVDLEIRRAHEWIAENGDDDSEKDRPDRSFGDVDTRDHPTVASRGIFDDVDE